MAKNRSAGEGSFTQRKDGRWMGRISLGYDFRGKHVRKTVYGKTLKECKEKANRVRADYESGMTNEKAVTVGQFLDQWMADDVKVRSGNKTIREYEDTCRAYIKPYIGKLRLDKLTSLHCRQWQGQLTREGFTANMRKKSLRVFSVAIHTAMRSDLIIKNPLLGVPRPKVTRREIHPLEPEQCQLLFKHCNQHRLGDVTILAKMTGLRKGELFALQWEDVNIAERVLTVRRSLEEVGGKLRIKEPKTKAGRRAVILDPIGARALEQRLKKASDEGLGPDDCQIVFPSRIGNHLRGSNFDRAVWYPIRKAAGIPETVRFHDLRHTQASLMLAAGIHPKIVQERLGHGDISLTMNTYSHLLAGLQAASVERMGAMIPAMEEDEAES